MKRSDRRLYSTHYKAGSPLEWNLHRYPQGTVQQSRSLDYKGLCNVGELDAHLGLGGNEFRMCFNRAKMIIQG